MIKHKHYLKIAKIIAKNSKAKRKKVGCVIVKNDNIISLGYNGAPSKFNNKCEYNNGKTKRSVLHAESNAISKCAKNNSSCKNAKLYVTLCPCLECAKLIIQSGIKAVYYKSAYRNKKGLKLLKKAKIKIYGI